MMPSTLVAIQHPVTGRIVVMSRETWAFLSGKTGRR